MTDQQPHYPPPSPQPQPSQAPQVQPQVQQQVQPQVQAQPSQAQPQYPPPLPQQQQYPQPPAQEPLPSLYLELLPTEQTRQQSTPPRPALLQAQPYTPLQMQQLNPPQPQVRQPYSQLQVYVPPLIQPQPHNQLQGQSQEHQQPAHQQPQPSQWQQPPFPQPQPHQQPTQPQPASVPATAHAPQTPSPQPAQPPKKRARLVVGIVAGSVGFLLMLAALAIVFILPLWRTAPTWAPQPVVSREEPAVSLPSAPEPEPSPAPADAPADLTEYVEGVTGPSLADRANMDPEDWIALERAALEEATQKTGATAQTAFFEGAFVNDYHFDVFEFRADGTFSWYKDLDAYANAYNNFYEGTYTVYPVARATDGLNWLDNGYITRNNAGEVAQTIILNADTFFDEEGNVDWYYDWTFCLSAYLASEAVGDGFYALNSATSGDMQGYVRFDDNMLAIKRLMMNLDGSQDTIALPWG
jgi:hypothetical protein